ncbi:hypothetical protein [Rickettsia bellii]|uniref:Uncharacterized protein n=1 Tax=Rickettsia bellii str. RML Mogi TaxID=1359194 RepID=A0A0F3QJK3_RICBE|nr:hypothetical protein [Rickettsia bellii]KJV92336.1 hypothetical protein RBEMOGI_0964 [Rickettsia bellii str. RML Mogi]
MNNIVEKRIALIEPYLDFIIKNEELLRENYPNGLDRDLMIEFILAKKPYKSYAYYTLIRSLFKSPCNKIILIIDKQLLKSFLGLFRSIIFGTLSYLKLIKIFIYDENDFALDIKALKSDENYFWSYKINYFKKLINGE